MANALASQSPFRRPLVGFHLTAALCLGLLAHCGGEGASSEQAKAPVGTSYDDPTRGSKSSGDAGTEGGSANSPDASLGSSSEPDSSVGSALADAGLGQGATDASSEDADGGQASDKVPLSLNIEENGPGVPWVLEIANTGPETVRLVADPRLLQLSVHVPGRRKPVTCKLPKGLFPSYANRKLTVNLPPGEGVSHSFDARLYCYASQGQKVLVPGATIYPSFGWPEKKSRTRWKRGKREKVPATQLPPFVAGPLSAPKLGEDLPRPRKGSDAGAPEEMRIKRLEGEVFGLHSEYAEWAATRLPNQEKENPGPLQLQLVQGSDAHAERTATIRLSLKNRSKQARRIYFRRELVSFEVMGPGGAATCDAQPDQRAPDPQSFMRLGAGGRITITSRLVEMCPRGTFAIPGFYLVHARLDANETGERFGINAFTGTVVSPEPAGIRIRTSEQGMLKVVPMRPISDKPEAAKQVEE